jgi:hypothetical protein
MYARSRNADDLVDRVQGVRIASHIPCDGATNPQEDVGLATTFSPSGLQRAFHLDVFESQYCKRLDLYFFCLTHGHDRWKHEWVQDNQSTGGNRRFWINSCTAWESKDAPEYILSGWYREGASKKEPWKQATLKRVSETPEIYEFTDPKGGTARIEVKHK